MAHRSHPPAQPRVMTAKVIAGCLALAAFAVAIVAGLAADISAAQILLRAVLCMFVAYPVGYVIGLLCEHVVAEQVRGSAAPPAPPPAAVVSPAERAAAASPPEEPIVV